jgi:hypothetical protein
LILTTSDLRQKDHIMLSMSLFAQMNAFKPDGPQVGGFGVVTLAFLFMVWLFDKR